MPLFCRCSDLNTRLLVERSVTLTISHFVSVKIRYASVDKTCLITQSEGIPEWPFVISGYDAKNHISLSKPHNQVLCMRRKCHLLFLNTSFHSRGKYADQPRDDVIHSTKLWSIMMEKDISATLYKKYMILCCKIKLNLVHNMSLTVCYHDNILGSRPPQYWRLFWLPFAFHWYLPMVPHLHDPASIYIIFLVPSLGES